MCGYVMQITDCTKVKYVDGRKKSQGTKLSKIVQENDAICIIRNWLATEFKGGRYEERLKMVEEIEKNNMK